MFSKVLEKALSINKVLAKPLCLSGVITGIKGLTNKKYWPITSIMRGKINE